jgi:aspartate/methionine/tyrosine aminotransferase
MTKYYSYYEWTRSQFASKRLILEEGLNSLGIKPLKSHGGFFLMGELPQYDLRSLPDLTYQHLKHFENESYDWQFCRMMATYYQVAAIPASPFFSQDSNHPPLARFAFCKKEDTMKEACNRLLSKPVPFQLTSIRNSTSLTCQTM